MLEKLILSIFVSKPESELDEDYLKRQTVVCLIVGIVVLAISIPGLQYILAEIESGALVEKVAGAVKPIGIAIMASGFYMLLRGCAHYYLLRTNDY